MDFSLLDRIFPQTASYPGNGRSITLEQNITIGGAPIVECLASMMQLIRSQQHVIQDLQEQIQNQSEDQVQRVDRLERYVSHLTLDVKLDERPVSAYGQGPMPTMADALTTVEYRLTQVENKRRQQLLRQVFIIANSGRRRDAYQQWSLVARAKGMLRDLCVGQAKRVRQRYLAKWIRYIAISKADQVNKRRVRALSYLSTKNIVQRYYDKLRRYLVVSKEEKLRARLEAGLKVDGMAAVSMRAVARRYLVRWTQFLAECRTMQFRVKSVLSMEQLRSRQLASEYLAKWIAHHKLLQCLQSRMSVVGQQSARAFRGLALRYLEKWKLCSRRRILRRQTKSVVPRMHHLHLVALARRYFAKMELFSKWNAERREKEAMQLAIQQLARRCDVLGVQLDLGLQTLSHTNGVLSKVLEHVSFNSSWERKRGGSSQSPQQPQGDAAATPTPSQPTSSHLPAGRGEWGDFNYGGEDDFGRASVSADDLLLQLRSRLQRVNEQPAR